MSISKFPAERKPAFIPAGGSGSYSFPNPVPPGMYLIETDTTQNISASNLFVETGDGFRVGAAVRGGQGFISIPVQADTIYVNSGTFPLPLTITERDYLLLDAASASAQEYVSGSIEVVVDLPSGATDWNLFWPDGTSASYSGSAASVAIPGGISFPFVVGVAAYDDNLVLGRIGVSNTINQVFYEYLASGTFTPEPSVSFVDVYVLAGGGSSGTAFCTSPRVPDSGKMARGGGGGGQYVFIPAVPVSGSVSVVVGAGAAAGGNGNATTVGSASAAGGIGAGSIPAAVVGEAGFASGEPYSGGTAYSSVNSDSGGAGGGGGGAGGAGGNATNSPTMKGGDGGIGVASIFGTPVGGGGGGGAQHPAARTGGTASDGGGAGAGIGAQQAASGANGAANRGGGGGGGAAHAQPLSGTSAPGSNGGSGRVLIKALYS